VRLHTDWDLNIRNLLVNCLSPKPSKLPWNFELHLIKEKMRTRKEDINRAIIYISRNLSAKIQVKELATVSNMSEFHFFKLFKEETNTTPQKFIENLKLDKALHLLKLNPFIKITTLAFDSGFSSPSYFNQSFKKKYGVNPTKYKRKFLKSNSANQNQKPSNNRVDVVYHKTTYLKTWLATPDVTGDKNSNIDFDIPAKAKIVYGIYLDAPFHKPIQECRYLIGYDCEDEKESNYQIESGYFSKMRLTDRIENELVNIVSNYNQILDSGFRIKSPVGIERYEKDKLLSNNTSAIERNLYMPIIKKSQDI